MTLKIHNVRYRNLLATGNDFTEVKFDNRRTLIIGPNGSGKTTLIEALCFVLYNRPFRKVNRGKLINSITNKGLLVECEFAVFGREYLVRRGVKPNVFEIYMNGELIEPPADSRDYQRKLEDDILRMNFRTFCQIVVLGSRNFEPFMQLTAADRRSVVENLLDIEVFSVMNTLLKERMDASKKEIETSDYALRDIAAQEELNRKRLEASRRDFQSLIKERQHMIDELEVDYAVMKDEGEAKFDELKELEYSTVKIKESLPEIDKLRAADSFSFYEIRQIKDGIAFLEEHTICPTCSQPLTEEYRTAKIKEMTLSLTEVTTKKEGLSKRLQVINEKILANDAIVQKKSLLEAELQKRAAEIKNNRWNVTNLQKEIEGLQEKMAQKVDDITLALETRKTELMTEREVILRRAKVLSVAASLLRDGGVKTIVVRKFIPWLNDTVNKYLEMLDLFVVFEMNEEFEEKIYSRGRDDFNYNCLSEGEKLRLDLALLWAWRELGRSRASIAVNLLIMDEILDSSLDTEGVDEFMKVLDKIGDGENVLVISHRGESFVDRFDRVLRFNKYHNFSKLEEAA